MKYESEVVRMLANERVMGERSDHACRPTIAYQAVRVSVQYDRSIRFVAVEKKLQDSTEMGHLPRRQGCMTVDVCISRRLEQPIPFAQLHVQRFRQNQHRLAARLG